MGLKIGCQVGESGYDFRNYYMYVCFLIIIPKVRFAIPNTRMYLKTLIAAEVSTKFTYVMGLDGVGRGIKNVLSYFGSTYSIYII